MAKNEIDDLVAYYSRQVSAHVGPVISIFFSLIGMLVLVRTSSSIQAKVFFRFHISYWVH